MLPLLPTYSYSYMSKSRRKKHKYRNLRILIGVCATFVVLGYFILFSSMSRSGKIGYVFLDKDDNVDSVYKKVEPLSTRHSFWAFKQIARIVGFKDKDVRTGRYAVGSMGALQTFRYIRNHRQAAVSITIRSVRTLADLSRDVTRDLLISRKTFMQRTADKKFCRKYGYTPETIIAIFIPDTYDFYWDTDIDGFFDKIDKENKRFWSFERMQKAKEEHFTPVEVMTLASIVDEETDNEKEMPMIAGMYINRLRARMPLQADPTVKFATKNFTAHRIYHKWLTVDSPYNTYKYRGLPPGPIRIPSVAAIDAVLDYVHHDYMYMCAKEDFSGTHNFAKTYAEHQVNAAKYAKALNERGIE